MKKHQKAWLKYYEEEGIPEHLEYLDGSMVDAVMEVAKENPDLTAYTYYGHKVSYKSFVKKIEKAARALKNYGVKEGDRVTICMPNTPEGITMVYAVNMVGGVLNMVHPLSSEKELEYYIKTADSKYVLVFDAIFDKIYKLVDTAGLKRIIVARPSDGLGYINKKLYKILHVKKVRLPRNDARVVLWEDFIANSYFYEGDFYEKRKPDDVAAILYSGGTTGAPKGIMLTNLNFNAMGKMETTVIKQAEPGASILAILPIFHGFGLGVCIHGPLTKGMNVILIPAFTYKEFPEMIRKNRPNFIVGVPTLFESLTRARLKDGDLKSVTVVISGGDTLQKSLRDEVNECLEKYGSEAKIRAGFGLTEATGAICLSPENTFEDGMIGAPFPDMDVKIVKIGTFDEAKPEEDGEICVRGPLVMQGYLNEPVETAKALQEHEDGKVWLHTGDVGHMGKDGFVYFTQRLKRIIVVSGYNVYPTYLESVIDSHEGVLTSTVIGVDHPHKGQVPKAFIVLKEGYKPGRKIEKEIRELLERHVAAYALPASYEFRDSLPKTAVGKVAFRKLEEEEKGRRKNRGKKTLESEEETE